jgi:hypothetical protein
MKLYNLLLIEKYEVEKLDYTEIDLSYFKELENDFISQYCDIESLQVYPYEAVINFIKDSANQCVMNIKLLIMVEI